jgi:hypothetical protein
MSYATSLAWTIDLPTHFECVYCGAVHRAQDAPYGEDIRCCSEIGHVNALFESTVEISND